MIEDLVIKYLNGDTSSEENRQVIQWIKESPKNLREFQAYRRLHDLAQWNPELLSVNPNICQKPSRFNISHYFIEFAKIAAVVILTIVGWHFFDNQDDQEVWQTVFSPLGQRTEVYLADGTKVWLNSQTKLTYPTHFTAQNRTVNIEGEAYFKVTKDSEHPFIVKAKGYDIKVLGTEFNIHAYPNNNYFETFLVTGRVNISSKQTGEKIDLTPNMQASSHGGKLNVIHNATNPHFLWRKGIISFDDDSIEQLSKKLERYFDVKINVKNKSTKKIRYTGKFRITDGIHHILRTLELRKEFIYLYDEKNNTITIL